MARPTGRRDAPDDEALLELFRAIAARDEPEISRRLDARRDLAGAPIRSGASRQVAERYFLDAIAHHVYEGDTALHIASAAHHRGLAELLVSEGVDVRARNRRGAEPLHYAADGSPGAAPASVLARGDVIRYLVDVGADPNAVDKSGVAPLHRAVRNRCSAAVSTLIELGADPRRRNGTGSTPLHLAVQNTGKSNSGTTAARAEQARIIVVLIGAGARPTDIDGKGTTVAAAATSDWIRELLAAG